MTPPLPAPDLGPLQGRSRLRRAAHLALWTALFYLLTVGVAKLAEWASP